MLTCEPVRVFLDSKDLINLVRRSEPMSIAEGVEWFRQRSATLVLAFSSVSEFVPPSETDWLKVRAELQALESFPHCYIRLGDIQCGELEAAVSAYSTKQAPASIQPYVSDFWRTFWPLRPTTFDDVVFMNELERRVGFRLDEQVRLLWSDKRNFRNETGMTARVQGILDGWRAGTGSALTRFSAEIPEALASCGSNLGQSTVDSMARWLFELHSLASGLRLHYGVLFEYAANMTDSAKSGDLSDVSHLFGIPYFDFATLDRCFLDYVTRASQRLRKFDSRVDDTDRVYRSFGELVKALP